MQGAGFFVGFFVILIILALTSTNEERGFRIESMRESESTTTIDTRGTDSDRTETISAPSSSSAPPPQKPSPRLSPSEIEKKLERLYRELDDLEKEARELKLRSPISPYFGDVDLRIGNARSTDPEREYLTIHARGSNDSSINISDWYLESYVTEEVAALPEGSRLMDHFRTRETSPILLEPGERAFVLTADPPYNVSFRENLCTGYLRELNRDVYPSLRRSCPRPIDELEDFGLIDLDDDACYEFIEDVSRCEIVDEREMKEADVSRICEVFVRDYLDYNSCAEHHLHEPNFDNIGSWRIYLSRDRRDDEFDEEDDPDFTPDLWRKEREIIRLIDENDKVVDVIEY